MPSYIKSVVITLPTGITGKVKPQLVALSRVSGETDTTGDTDTLHEVTLDDIDQYRGSISGILIEGDVPLGTKSGTLTIQYTNGGTYSGAAVFPRMDVRSNLIRRPVTQVSFSFVWAAQDFTHTAPS